MKRTLTVIAILIALSLTACAPQARPRATYRTVVEATPAHVYELVEDLVIHAPKPRKATKRWTIVTRDSATYVLSAKALVRRAPTTAKTGPGFERVDIRVTAYGEAGAELTMDYTNGAGYKLVQQVRVGVKKRLEAEQAAARLPLPVALVQGD